MGPNRVHPHKDFQKLKSCEVFRPISKDVLEQRFLTGETLCCFDTELMPKLQHIRVAGKFFVGFEIPESMTHLWGYIREMYQLDAFTQSCPADQVHIYKKLSKKLSKNSQNYSSVELYPRNVSAGCFHTVLSGRSGTYALRIVHEIVHKLSVKLS